MFPIVFLLGLGPAIRQTIALVAYILVTIGVVIAIFVPKMYRVYNGVTVQKNMDVVQVSGQKSVSYGAVPDTSYVDDGGDTLKIASPQELASKNPEDAFKICKSQIKRWQAMLLRLQTATDTDSNERKSSRVHAGPEPEIAQPKSSISAFSRDAVESANNVQSFHSDVV